MYRSLTVYILASWSRALYSTSARPAIWRPVEQHRAGISTHTSRYEINRFVNIEEYADPRDVIARGRKGSARTKKVALIELANPTWRDLDASRYG